MDTRPNPRCGARPADDFYASYETGGEMTRGRWIVAGILLAGVAFATVQGLRPRPPPPVEVTTSLAKRGPITRLVTAAGHLQAHQTVKVSSNISGDLLSLAVKEGDHLARTKTLVDHKLASQADLDKALTQLKVDEGRLAAQKELVAQNQGQLETALYNLSRATLTAPIEGTILEIQHKVGERIRGSDLSEDVVLIMGGLSDMEVKAEVGEHEVVGIHEGNEATIEIDAIPDKQFKGYVSGMVKNAQIKNPGTDQEVTTFFVYVAFAEHPEAALPGMSAAVSIATATHDNVVTVP